MFYKFYSGLNCVRVKGNNIFWKTALGEDLRAQRDTLQVQQPENFYHNQVIYAIVLYVSY